MPHVLTRHAETRMRQRAVPADVLELLLLHGEATPAKGRAMRFRFDRIARAELRRALADGTERRDIERWFNTAAIVGTRGEVITVIRTDG